MRTTTQTAWLLISVLVASLPAQSHARKPRTISFVPDPSCRGNRLVGTVESALEEHFEVKDVKVTRKDRGKANILLQYFLLVRKDGDEVRVQLDGNAFENHSGRLLAEGTASSDAHPDNPKGRKTAAQQAGQLLAEDLSTSLTQVLWAKGKGRRVMLQITLEENAGLTPDKVISRLSRSLGGAELNLKGSTERNLVVVFRTSERLKLLVEAIERALTGSDQLQVTWVVQSSRTLLLRLGREGD